MAPPDVESKYAPPLVECVNCNHMLPQGLGEIECEICGAICRVTHNPTVEALKSESVQCPHCLVKVEIECPSCESGLRIRPRPGKRELTCPGCTNSFNVTF